MFYTYAFQPPVVLHPRKDYNPMHTLGFGMKRVSKIVRKDSIFSDAPWQNLCTLLPGDNKWTIYMFNLDNVFIITWMLH